MSLREHWDQQANNWARFVREGHDWMSAFLLRALFELLPLPGRATLDVGCGEGRVGTRLTQLGHTVVGIDASPRLVELAREHHDAVVADAASLPFPDRSFDLVVSSMCLMDVDDMPRAVREAARVLEPGGSFCFTILHPLFSAGRFAHDGSFVIEGSYVETRRHAYTVDTGDVQMTFSDEHRPLEAYTSALETAGLALETLREPTPSHAELESEPRLARWRGIPLVLAGRAAKTSR